MGVDNPGVENAGVENVVPSIKGENNGVSVKISFFLVYCLLSSPSLLLLLLSSTGREDSVCAPMEWLTADRNCIRLYAPLS